MPGVWHMAWTHRWCTRAWPGPITQGMKTWVFLILLARSLSTFPVISAVTVCCPCHTSGPPDGTDRSGGFFLVTVTVGIPFYGDEDMLRRCVRSLLRQTYRDLRVLVVGDGQEPRIPTRDRKSVV